MKSNKRDKCLLLYFFFFAQKTDLHFQQPGRQTFHNEDVLVSFTSLCSCWRNSKLFVRDRSGERKEDSGQTFFFSFFPAKTIRLTSQMSHFPLGAPPCISASTSLLTHVATTQTISAFIGLNIRLIFICHEYDAEL